MANQPRMLEGYRVLDFTQFVAGPTCTRLLAEMGAEVIKLELAPSGDRVRAGGLKSQAPEHKDSSHSTYYLQHNHSKLSLAIDLKKPGAREIVMAMLPNIDVVVENFAPHVIDRLGFSYDDIKKVNPKIIMCSISMAGQTGPLSYKAGYDFIGQSYAGVTDGIGEADGAPAMTTMAIGDVSTGVAAAMAVGFALLHRERTGEGQYLDASLLDTYFHMHEQNVPAVSLRGDKFRPRRSGSLHPDGGPTGILSLSRRPVCLPHRGAASMATVSGARWGCPSCSPIRASRARAAGATIASSCARSSRSGSSTIPDSRRCDRRARQGARAMRARAVAQRGGQASASE